MPPEVAEQVRTEAKVATLEAAVRANADQIDSMARQLERFKDDVKESISQIAREHRQGIEGLRSDLQQQGKTDWPKIIGVLSLGFGVMGMLGGVFVTGISREIDRLGVMVERGVANSMDHVLSDGHNGLATRVDANSRMTQQHAESAAVEHRALTQAIERSAESLDRRLQLEMRLLGDVGEERMNGLQHRLEQLEQTNP